MSYSELFCFRPPVASLCTGPAASNRHWLVKNVASWFCACCSAVSAVVDEEELAIAVARMNESLTIFDAGNVGIVLQA